MADQGIQSKGISKSEETKSSATGGETVDNIDVVVSAEGGSLDANEEHTLSVSAGERKGGESGSQNTNEEHTGPVVEQKSDQRKHWFKRGQTSLLLAILLTAIGISASLCVLIVSKTVMHVIRISFHVLGSIFVLILGVYRCIKNSKQDYIDFQKITFSKIKIFVMYILGLWHFLYCGFYGWKYGNLGNILGVFSYISSIFYTFSLFITLTMFHERKDDNTWPEAFCTFCIVLVNIFTSIDVLSSDFMFKTMRKLVIFLRRTHHLLAALLKLLRTQTSFFHLL
ncbi:uncharacterized protein LOC128170398 isoform X7 [Crassostrea angulata]|uniref:uncharacterized protein LOC128170398 isoform X7 n=1 Tax=Magallana angulata TaxID=2784310 RepID=UPI0022B0CE51|nr:uncharacterized protein LOC128170398 isoform X7 [Crassostrea angulata]